jgi:hypothetical protein
LFLHSRPQKQKQKKKLLSPWYLAMDFVKIIFSLILGSYRNKGAGSGRKKSSSDCVVANKTKKKTQKIRLGSKILLGF